MKEIELKIKLDVNYVKVLLQILALGDDKVEFIMDNLPEDGELPIDLNILSNQASGSIKAISPDEMLQIKFLLTSLIAAQVVTNLEKKEDTVKP
jgi:hypothetical protein